jgi:hypothetical protein
VRKTWDKNVDRCFDDEVRCELRDPGLGPFPVREAAPRGEGDIGDTDQPWEKPDRAIGVGDHSELARPDKVVQEREQQAGDLRFLVSDGLVYQSPFNQIAGVILAVQNREDVPLSRGARWWDEAAPAPAEYSPIALRDRRSWSRWPAERNATASGSRSFGDVSGRGSWPSGEPRVGYGRAGRTPPIVTRNWHQSKTKLTFRGPPTSRL